MSISDEALFCTCIFVFNITLYLLFVFLRTASQHLDFRAYKKVFYTPLNTYLSHETMPLTVVILPPRPMAAAFRRAVLATAVPMINWKREYNIQFTVVSKKKTRGGSAMVTAVFHDSCHTTSI